MTLTDAERMTYAVAEPDVKYRLAATAESKSQVVIDLVAKHRGTPTLVIGQYVDQLLDLAERLDAPVITGETTVRQREKLYEAFRTGRDRPAGGEQGGQLLGRPALGPGGDPGVGRLRLPAGGGATARPAAAAQEPTA